MPNYLAGFLGWGRIPAMPKRLFQRQPNTHSGKANTKSVAQPSVAPLPGARRQGPIHAHEDSPESRTLSASSAPRCYDDSVLARFSGLPPP